MNAENPRINQSCIDMLKKLLNEFDKIEESDPKLVGGGRGKAIVPLLSRGGCGKSAPCCPEEGVAIAHICGCGNGPPVVGDCRVVISELVNRKAFLLFVCCIFLSLFFSLFSFLVHFFHFLSLFLSLSFFLRPPYQVGEKKKEMCVPEVGVSEEGVCCKMVFL